MKVRKYYHHVYNLVNIKDCEKYWNDIEVFINEFGRENIKYYTGNNYGFITCDMEVII
ncbi:hypothetical protein [Clostridium sp.]|uniref:hypothetical protein n=1 Tax=Clostridium sp. TaxID=1506 RepID=UPI0032166077